MVVPSQNRGQRRQLDQHDTPRSILDRPGSGAGHHSVANRVADFRSTADGRADCRSNGYANAHSDAYAHAHTNTYTNADFDAHTNAYPDAHTNAHSFANRHPHRSADGV